MSYRAPAKGEPHPCACGCGTMVVPNSNGDVAKYIRGHFHRGRKHSPEWAAKQAASVKKAWAEGKYEGKTRPDYEAIGQKLRGRKRHEHEIEATRKGVAEAHRRGAYKTPAVAANRERLKTLGHGQSAEHMDRIRKMRDMEALRPTLQENGRRTSQKLKENGTMQRLTDWNRKRLTGGHGQGKNKMGSLEHSNAMFWQIRSPFGEIFEFINLREWVRRNISLFHDYRPESRLPFEYRVTKGIERTHHPRRRNAPTHYQGWTVVIGREKDLLGRDEALFANELFEQSGRDLS